MPKRIWINPIIPPSFPFSAHPSILLFPLPPFRSHPFFFSSFSSAFFVSFLPSPSSPHIKSLGEQPHWCFFFLADKNHLCLYCQAAERGGVCARAETICGLSSVCLRLCFTRDLCVFSRIVAIFPIFSLQPCSSQLFLFQSLFSTHTRRHTHKNHLPSYWMTSSNGI